MSLFVIIVTIELPAHKLDTLVTTARAVFQYNYISSSDIDI